MARRTMPLIVLSLVLLIGASTVAAPTIDVLTQYEQRIEELERILFGDPVTRGGEEACSDLNSTECKYEGQEYLICNWDPVSQRCYCTRFTC